MQRETRLKRPKSRIKPDKFTRSELIKSAMKEISKGQYRKVTEAIKDKEVQKFINTLRQEDASLAKTNLNLEGSLHYIYRKMVPYNCENYILAYDKDNDRELDIPIPYCLYNMFGVGIEYYSIEPKYKAVISSMDEEEWNRYAGVHEEL